MNSRQHHLSCANSYKSSQHSSPASRLIVRIHVSFGLPLPLLPCTCQPGVPRTITHSLLKTCPSHFHRDNLRYSSTGCPPVISLTLSFETLSHHLTPKILRKALFENHEFLIRCYCTIPRFMPINQNSSNHNFINFYFSVY